VLITMVSTGVSLSEVKHTEKVSIAPFICQSSARMQPGREPRVVRPNDKRQMGKRGVAIRQELKAIVGD